MAFKSKDRVIYAGETEMNKYLHSSMRVVALAANAPNLNPIYEESSLCNNGINRTCRANDALLIWLSGFMGEK